MNNTGTKSYKDDSCYVNVTTKYEVKQVTCNAYCSSHLIIQLSLNNANIQCVPKKWLPFKVKR